MVVATRRARGRYRALTVTAPGAPYVERADPAQWRTDMALSALWGGIERRVLSRWRLRSLARFADTVMAQAATAADLTDRGLREAGQALRVRLVQDGIAPDHAAWGFALAREACRRHLGLAHYRVQIIGAAAMLGGALAEMETGEGKTITAVLTAAVFALAGRPVHVITVNDYLARRDAAQLRPVYEALGLSVGLVVHGLDADLRRAGYACDVTYCTNKDVVFDYLRDRMALGARRSAARRLVDDLSDHHRRDNRLLLRGLQVAIVDEADSVLIDEARTPLILSGNDGHEGAAEMFDTALDLARALVASADFIIRRDERAVNLTPDGRTRLTDMTATRAGIWLARRAREELVEQALQALHFFHRDVQYVVVDGKVQIVDEYTGRVMPDRTWERGLHQIIEAKEGCEISDRRRTLARITYQRFFRRYGHLCGMSGTAAEVASELRAVYRLPVTPVPTNHPLKRRKLGNRLYATTEAKVGAIVESVGRMVGQGRAVLIGTRSVSTSEFIGRKLAEAGLTCVVLNAHQDRDEAEIVNRAGQPGRITVATNMAGRGTDIRLDQSVRAAGGLHVILTEYHESARIDRQLFGRGGRQGDAGSYEAIVSLEDELFQRFMSTPGRRGARALADRKTGLIEPRLGELLRNYAQATAERIHARTRRETLRTDQRLERSLAFSGKGE